MSPTSSTRTPQGAIDLASYWDRIFTSKRDEETSWYEASPALSLELIGEAARGAFNANVLDVGGGTSRLVDELLSRGSPRVGVVDVSKAALARTKTRLGERGNIADFIHTDITSVDQIEGYSVWHDRAMFHFLVDEEDVRRYVHALSRSVPAGGHAVIATFGPEGPTSCSGLPTHRYSAEELSQVLAPAFTLRSSRIQVHAKPAGGTQQFLYGLFERRDATTQWSKAGQGR